jgi:hypothetical protein
VFQQYPPNAKKFRMAVAPCLVVSLEFNPPLVHIVGPITEQTINKLNEILPYACTNSIRGRKEPPQFTVVDAPLPAWRLEMRTLFCNEVSIINFMVILLDALEDEGGWSMKDTHAEHFTDHEAYTMFFVKKLR